MRVRVELRRTKKVKHGTLHEYFKVTADFEGDWRKVSDHQRFRQSIRKKYSGCSIVIYGPER